MRSNNTTNSTAKGTPFDPTGTLLTARNVQDAIIQNRENILQTVRFTIVTTFNGSIGNNQWLGYSELIPGDRVPIRLPINCKLREVSFSYSISSLLGIPLSSDQVDGRFDIYKNGTSAGNIVHQDTFTNQVGGKQITGLSISLSAGDYIVGRWIDSGDNPSDMVVVYYFEVT